MEYRYIHIASKVGIFPEAEGQGKYSLPRVQYVTMFHKEGLNIYSITQDKFYCTIVKKPDTK